MESQCLVAIASLAPQLNTNSLKNEHQETWAIQLANKKSHTFL
jgi:hypothetical protein